MKSFQTSLECTVQEFVKREFQFIIFLEQVQDSNDSIIKKITIVGNNEALHWSSDTITS